MQAKAFTGGLRAVASVSKYAKKIDDDSAQFIWLTIDKKVKDEVSDEMWVWAVKKTMESWKQLDHEAPLHITVLSFLYRNRDGSPEFSWGLKDNLGELMLAGSSPLSLGAAS